MATKTLRDHLEDTIKLGRTPLFLIQVVCAYYAVAIVSVAPEAARATQTRTDAIETKNVLLAASELQDVASKHLAKSKHASEFGSGGFGVGGFGGYGQYYDWWTNCFDDVQQPLVRFGFGGFSGMGLSDEYAAVEHTLLGNETASADLLGFIQLVRLGCTLHPTIVVAQMGETTGTKDLKTLHASAWFIAQERQFIESIAAEFDARVNKARGQLEELAESEPELTNPVETPLWGGLGSGGGFGTDADASPDEQAEMLTWDNASARQKLYWLDQVEKPTPLATLHDVYTNSLDDNQVGLIKQNLHLIAPYSEFGLREHLHQALTDLNAAADSVPDISLPVVGSSVPADFGLTLAGPIIFSLFHYWILCFFRIRQLELELRAEDPNATASTWSGRLFTQTAFPGWFLKLNRGFGVLMLFGFPILVPLAIGVLLWKTFFWGALISLVAAALVLLDATVVKWCLGARLLEDSSGTDAPGIETVTDSAQSPAPSPRDQSPEEND